MRRRGAGSGASALVRVGLPLAASVWPVHAPLPVPEGVVKAPLMDDVADIALPASHPRAHQATVALDDLAAVPWIAWLEGSICHDWLAHTLRRRGHEPGHLTARSGPVVYSRLC